MVDSVPLGTDDLSMEHLEASLVVLC